MAKKNNIERKWYVVDATDKPLGRLASQVAKILQGKHKPVYTPHVDTGDFVIVLNADKVKLTGRKAQQSMVYRYSG
ncbi:MAG: 50S ribosomal protein L13, partial [Synergistales bacterium 54_9]